MIRIDFSQVERWANLLDEEAAQIGRRVEFAVGVQTQEVAARARTDAPVGETKQLRGSIRPTGRRLRRRVVAGGGKAYYARFQEFGTRKMPAHPFLLKQANDAAQAEFEKRVDDAIGMGGIYG